MQFGNKRRQNIKDLAFEIVIYQMIPITDAYNNHPNGVKTFLPIGYKKADNDINCARRMGTVV